MYINSIALGRCDSNFKSSVGEKRWHFRRLGPHVSWEISQIYIEANVWLTMRVFSHCLKVYLKLIIQTSDLGTHGETVLMWKPQNTIDDNLILAQVMARCHQATSHYISQCWPRAMSPYGIIRPQWDIGQVTKLRLSCYLVLLSVDSQTR